MAAPRTAVMANVASTLAVQHLTVRRGDAVVVDDVSFEVKPLELHGLVGQNGAGKTSVLEAVAGLVDAAGDVLLGPVPLDREHRRQHVFYVPDGSPPFPDERAADVVGFAARSLGVEGAARDDVIERLELRAFLHRRMRHLRKGERKRVLLGIALLVPEGFVLVDEPFDGLDLKEARALTNVLRTSTNEKRSLLCALQSAGDAERLCDRFTLMSRGRVAGAGALHELRAHARAHAGAPLEEVLLALS